MADTVDLPWKGWRRSYIPIRIGSPSSDGASLRSLSERDGLAPIVERIAVGLASEQRYAALTALHYAIGAVAQLLIAPFALDGVIIDVAPDDLGITVDAGGVLTSVWIRGAAGASRTATPAGVSGLVAGLVPIAATVSALMGTPNRATTLVLVDAIERACRRLERAHDCRPERGWVSAVLATIGDPAKPIRRTFTVTPDVGLPIEMDIPRVCCVLATAPGPLACPACPQRSASERRATTEAWLRSLDETGFLAETGRRRVATQAPGAGYTAP